MIFLPGSVVATIFSMPIFDWKARWWDMYLNYVPQSSMDIDSSSTGTSPLDPGPGAVLSGYFWIYLGLTLFLTAICVLSFSIYFGNWKLTSVLYPFRATWEEMKWLYRHLKPHDVSNGHRGRRRGTDIEMGRL